MLVTMQDQHASTEAALSMQLKQALDAQHKECEKCLVRKEQIEILERQLEQAQDKAEELETTVETMQKRHDETVAAIIRQHDQMEEELTALKLESGRKATASRLRSNSTPHSGSAPNSPRMSSCEDVKPQICTALQIFDVISDGQSHVDISELVEALNEEESIIQDHSLRASSDDQAHATLRDLIVLLTSRCSERVSREGFSNIVTEWAAGAVKDIQVDVEVISQGDKALE